MAQPQGVFDNAAGKKTLGKRLNPYFYLIPAFLVMGVITFYPMGFQFWMSFTDYGIKNLRFDAPLPNWVGFQNYIDILSKDLGLSSYSFWYSLGFNLFWTFSNVIFHVTMGIIIAVALNTEGLWFKKFYRAIYILPIIIPQIIVANIFRNMFDPDYGAINQGFAVIGNWFHLAPEMFHIRWIEQLDYPISWLPLTLSYFALLITNVWLGWPFMTIVATGALQSIPKELYEAAEIDGQEIRKDVAGLADDRAQHLIVVEAIPRANRCLAGFERIPGEADMRGQVVAVRLVHLEPAGDKVVEARDRAPEDRAGQLSLDRDESLYVR